MADFEVGPLPNQVEFGAIVTGLTPDMIGDSEVRKALYDLWIDKGLVVFKGLTGLETQLRLSTIYGKPEKHPLMVGFDSPSEDEAIAQIEYDPQDGDLYLVDGEVRGAYQPWHSDLAYMDKINHGGILRADTLPRCGGETGFIDQVAAYEALPAELKVQIEGLNVINSLYALDASKAKFGDRPEKCIRLSRAVQLARTHPLVQRRAIHPLVYTQADTGRKVLNVSPWHAVGIEGMENEEGDLLLRRVVDLSTRPERAYLHEWEADDMVLWDNWRMMHCARGVAPEESRKMRRTTIAGDYALGRFEAGEGATALE